MTKKSSRVTPSDDSFLGDDGYTSPVMERLGGKGELTLDLLAELVPVLQAGHAAQKRLADLEPGEDGAELVAAVNAGFAAQERLVMAAIPLVKHVANKELSRRSRWSTNVTFDDLFQEGVAGLLRGLLAYNPNGGQKSPTNYLGQWIQVEMRRNVEAIDNDFGVAYDAAERFRKIRAIRSRLHGELGREPSDEEILEAALDSTHSGGRNMGRLKKAAAPRRPITQAHLDEERRFRTRVGTTSRLIDSTDEYQPGATVISMAQPLDGVSNTAADEKALEEASKSGLTAIIATTITEMGVGEVQADIIARKYGLRGTDPSGTRDIASTVGVHRVAVGKVLEAFSQQMSAANGVFHQVCSRYTDLDLMSLGLGWVMTTLGEADPEQAPPIPTILTQDLRAHTPTKRTQNLPTREVPRGSHT